MSKQENVRRAYRTVAYMEDGIGAKETDVVVVVDPKEDGTTAVYIIPACELAKDKETKEDKEKAIDQFIADANTPAKPLWNFPLLHSHTTFDKRMRGFARFARTLEETERMLNRSRASAKGSGERRERQVKENLRKEKAIDGKDKTTEIGRLIAAAKSLRSDVSRANEFRSDYLRELIDLQGEARNLPLARAQREELRGIFDEISQYIKKLREGREELARKNKARIQELVQKAVQAAFSSSTEFKAIRDQLKAAQQELKQTYLPREDKDRFWKQLNEAFAELSKRQEKWWKEKKAKQEAEFDRVRGLLDSVTLTIGTTSDLRGAKQRLIEVQAQIKGADLSREHRDALFSRIKTAFDIINRRIDEEKQQRQREADRAYDSLSIQITEASNMAHNSSNFQWVRNELKEIKQSIFNARSLDRTRKSELLERVNSLFEVLNQRQGQQRAANQREYEERKEQQRIQRAIAQQEYNERKARQAAERERRRKEQQQKNKKRK